ncbi:addiction module protein [Nostoc sp.]|uniref:addiction module protein n=1 Tax=Nostoc sp. TaxID=1180 RepID=UPI002FF51EA5
MYLIAAGSAVWDSIAQVPEQIPVLDWQKEELAKRKVTYLQNPDSGSSWEEIKERFPLFSRSK